MKGKSMLKSTTRTSRSVSFTTDNAHKTPRQSPTSSNISTPQTESPPFLLHEGGEKTVQQKFIGFPNQ